MARTVGEWLACRTPSPPNLLRARIVAALGTNANRPVVDTEVVCLEAAEGLLARLCTTGFAGRRDAPDLLAADAMVTYALEFAAEDPRRFGDRATVAMGRFGALGAESA